MSPANPTLSEMEFDHHIASEQEQAIHPPMIDPSHTHTHAHAHASENGTTDINPVTNINNISTSSPAHAPAPAPAQPHQQGQEQNPAPAGGLQISIEVKNNLPPPSTVPPIPVAFQVAQPTTTFLRPNINRDSGPTLAQGIAFAPCTGKTKKLLKIKAKPKPKHTMSRYLPPNKDEAFIGPILSDMQETIQMIRRECPSLSASESISLRLRFDGPGPEGQGKDVQGVLFRVLNQSWPNAIGDVLPLVYIDVAKVTSTSAAQSLLVNVEETIPTNDKDVKMQMQDNEPNYRHQGSEQNYSLRGARAILANIDKAKTKGPLPLSVLQSTEGEEEVSWDQLVKDGTMLGMQGWSESSAKQNVDVAVGEKEKEKEESKSKSNVQIPWSY